MSMIADGTPVTADVIPKLMAAVVKATPPKGAKIRPSTPRIPEVMASVPRKFK